jgi:hypothetical protein
MTVAPSVTHNITQQNSKFFDSPGWEEAIVKVFLTLRTMP